MPRIGPPFPGLDPRPPDATIRRVWRAQDDALLARLEDESVLERLWSHAAPGAAPLPARAAGLVPMRRARPQGPDAIVRAERGDPTVLLALATPGHLAALPAAEVHHLALFHRARAEHRIARGEILGPARDAIDRSLTLSIAGWLALGREQTYLDALARSVIGGALPAAEIERAAGAIPLRGLDAAAAIAREGAHGRDPARARALAAIARVDEAITIAGLPVDHPLASRARAHAAALRAGIVHEVMLPITIELEELASRQWKSAEIAAVMERAADAWRWSGEEPEIEHAIVTELPQFAWDLYRERKWDEMRAIIRPIEPAIERLARRVEQDPAELPWAAQCAQAVVFRAELAPTLDVQISLAERGLRLCPTLRNARLVLADLLCARAERRIDQPVLVRGSDAFSEAAKDVTRATELFPELKRLPAIRERLGRHLPGGTR